MGVTRRPLSAICDVSMIDSANLQTCNNNNEIDHNMSECQDYHQ